MSARLEFPESNDGVVEGISDAGIETFKGNPFRALAREQGQNSSDARCEGPVAPVKIAYELIHVPTEEFPGYAELKSAIDAALKYWNERHSKKTTVFLENAKAMLKRKEIPCLRISDRNTTGLTDSNLTDRGNWFSLTKAKGVSEKEGGAGGSYGIGKNAFFANSALRTVFFSTHDKENRWAFQGVTNLVSHKNGNKLTKAIGFFGEPNGYSPIIGKTKIPSRFRCNGVGTDIIIAGFDPQKNWEWEVLIAFASNFFVAIHDGLLEISVIRSDSSKEEYQLNSATLADVINVAASHGVTGASDLLNFYDALTSPSATVENTSIEGVGEVELRLLKREGARKRVAMFRNTGLKIFEKDRFRTPAEFVGVFRCFGEQGNSLLRLLEPPAHDKWEPERHEDPSYAKKVLHDIDVWIREQVYKLQVPDLKDIQSLPGTERLLPDDFEEEFNESAPIEGDPHAKEVQHMTGVKRKTSFKPPVASTGGGGKPAPTPGAGGTKPGVGDGDNGGSKDGVGRKEEIEIDYRTFHDPVEDRYRMFAKFDEHGSFDIDIFAIGDDGKTEPISLGNATLVSEGKMKGVKANANSITDLKIAAPSRVEIQFDSNSLVPRTLFARVHRHA